MDIIIYLYHFICITILSTRRRESTFIGASTATGALVSIVIVFLSSSLCVSLSVPLNLYYRDSVIQSPREKKQMNVISVEQYLKHWARGFHFHFQRVYSAPGSKLGKIKNGTLLKSCEPDEEKWAHCCPCKVTFQNFKSYIFVRFEKTTLGTNFPTNNFLLNCEEHL